MRIKTKIKLIGWTVTLSIVAFLAYTSSNELAASLSFICGIIGSLLPLFIELLKDAKHSKTVTKSPESDLQNEELLISFLNNIINNLKENKFKKARTSIQDFRSTLITTAPILQQHPDTFRIILKTSATIEKEITQDYKTIRNKKDDLLGSLFEIKEVIESSIINRNIRTRSPLTIAGTAICFFLSITTLFFSYLLFITASQTGLAISLFLFSFFTTCFIGLLFNQRWAKTSLKVTFIAGTILMVIGMIYMYNINIPDKNVFLST